MDSIYTNIIEEIIIAAKAVNSWDWGYILQTVEIEKEILTDLENLDKALKKLE